MLSQPGPNPWFQSAKGFKRIINIEQSITVAQANLQVARIERYIAPYKHYAASKKEISGTHN